MGVFPTPPAQTNMGIVFSFLCQWASLAQRLLQCTKATKSELSVHPLLPPLISKDYYSEQPIHSSKLQLNPRVSAASACSDTKKKPQFTKIHAFHTSY